MYAHDIFELIEYLGLRREVLCLLVDDEVEVQRIDRVVHQDEQGDQESDNTRYDAIRGCSPSTLDVGLESSLILFKRSANNRFLKEFRKVLTQAPQGYEKGEPLAAEPFGHHDDLRELQYFVHGQEKCLTELVHASQTILVVLDRI